MLAASTASALPSFSTSTMCSRLPAPPLAELAANVLEGERLRGLPAALVEFNSATWKAKKDAGLSLAAEIAGIAVPEALAEFSDALQAMHRLV